MTTNTDPGSFISFIERSPSAAHAAAYGAELLEQAGFIRQDETKRFISEPGGYFIVRGGSLVAWIIRDDTDLSSAIRMVGTHTDSPGLKLKVNPDLEAHGFQQAAVEVYGGAILSSWFDRELEFAGTVVDAYGKTHLVRTGPVARVPHLAIHLDRGVNDNFAPAKQAHMQPIIGLDPAHSMSEVIADAAGLEDPSDIYGADLISVDTQGPRIFGSDDQFLATGRLDNLSSVAPAIEALIDAFTDPEAVAGSDICLLACFDHEEVGSGSRSGACGPIVDQVITRLVTALGGDADDEAAMIARSVCVSSDAAHSVHPNYPGKHDATNAPLLGKGPVIKVNANQRYATEAATAAMFRRVCVHAGVGVQVFVSNNDCPCGSTIGPLSATRLGMPTVDIGMAILSMHSAREMCAVADIDALRRALTTFFACDGWVVHTC